MPADEAAALWTVRLAGGELPHEQQVFEEWLELTPANREAGKRAQAGWDAFNRTEDDELLGAMREHARSARPSKAHDWRRYAAAAALLVVVAGGSIVADQAGLIGSGGGNSSTGRVQAPPLLEASYTYVNGRELPRHITLPDGSLMTLDAQSRVTATFSRNRRSLELVGGRAFFDVRHDPARPFVVGAGDLHVTDIGTRFDVELANDGVRLRLVQGRLSVSAAGLPKPVQMSAGERLTSRNGASPVVTQMAGEEALNWQQGFATFDNDTLLEAAAVLNRYPGDELIVRNPKVAGLRISGMFKMGDPERFGRTLEQIYPVRVVRRSEDRIEIVPAG
jgi:transmembrane sensor